ncbi:MAG: hypothetical protein HYZ42_03780 [Bacteroidetes bacterium]|nr:hypothetical protein [Bacteroidota bacterium]
MSQALAFGPKVANFSKEKKRKKKRKANFQQAVLGMSRFLKKYSFEPRQFKAHSFERIYFQNQL